MGDLSGLDGVDAATLRQYKGLLTDYLEHCHVLVGTLPSLREVSHRVMTFQSRGDAAGTSRRNTASSSRSIDAGVLRQIADLDDTVEGDNLAAEAGQIEDDEDDEDDDSDYDSEDDQDGQSPAANGAGSYCSLPNCARMFPHSHVGEGGNDTVFGMVHRQGAEALAKDFFSKV